MFGVDTFRSYIVGVKCAKIWLSSRLPRLATLTADSGNYLNGASLFSDVSL